MSGSYMLKHVVEYIELNISTMLVDQIKVSNSWQ